MKAYRFLMITTVLVVTGMLIVPACKYNAAEPMWDKPAPTVTTPSITGIIPPAVAAPGVNTITIQGQNFSNSLSDMMVFFNSTETEIISTSGTSVTVRRPNLAADSAVIKVSSAQGYLAVKYSPYNVDTVMERYGAFVASIPLAVVAVDSAENVFVVAYGTPYTFWKINPQGAAAQLSIAAVSPASKRTYSDARIHNGNLYLVGKAQREIQVANLSTGQLTRWTRLPSGKPANCGDFDANGNFYAGGLSSDLCIIPPNPASDLSTVKTSGLYLTDEILAIRVYNGYVYVASRQANTSRPAKIWKHTIDAAGNVGPQLLVVDLAGVSSSVVRGLAFSASGSLYITIADPNPLLVFDPSSNSLDYFYKSILPRNGQHATWGSSGNLYMISNDPNAPTAYVWNVVRIRMGGPGVAYY
jgi:hypothetical protein